MKNLLLASTAVKSSSATATQTAHVVGIGTADVQLKEPSDPLKPYSYIAHTKLQG